ncbi:MAG: helicase-related protein, partial [Candidatus Aenigmatarchaeota archaeon]
TDEIHLLNDENRGPTLEVVLTRLREETNASLMGLSATISNAKEIADWFYGELVSSDYRPVELMEGAYDGEGIDFVDGEYYTPKNNRDRGELSLTEDTLKKNKQSLIFASSRRNAESIAEKSSKVVNNFLDEDEKKELSELAEKILNVPSQPTKQCKRLAKCVRKGSAFHHAGLQNGQKTLIEDAFRDKLLKIISATPTLAMGINLPAWRVMIRDAKRYYPGKGSKYIPVLEYQQMSGRAGRPKYDDSGQSVLIGKSRGEAEEMKDRFIRGKAEEIFSKLSVEPILRMHTLSLISSEVTHTEDKLKEFFSKSFFAQQYGDIDEIEEKLERIMNRLEEQRFVNNKNGRLEPSRIGKRVAELYLDPETAYDLIDGLGSEKNGTLFAYLILVSNTREMRPCRMKKGEFDKIQEEIAKHEDEMLTEPPGPWDLSYDNFLKAMKTALVFHDWCSEKGED